MFMMTQFMRSRQILHDSLCAVWWHHRSQDIVADLARGCIDLSVWCSQVISYLASGLLQ